MSRCIRVAHHVPGRVRLHVPSIKGHPQAAHRLEQHAGSVEGVHGACANVLTGSMVIRYDRQDPHVRERLGNAIQDMEKLLSIAVPEFKEAREIGDVLAPDISFVAQRVPLLRPLVAMLRGTDRRVCTASDGTVNLATLMPLAVGAVFLLLAGRDTATRSTVLIAGLLLASLHSFATLAQQRHDSS